MLVDKWKVHKSFSLLYNLPEQKNNTMKCALKAPNLKPWEDDTCTTPHTRPLIALMHPDQIQWKFTDMLGNKKTLGIEKPLDEFQDML